jgi:hypothetical protein
MCRMRSCRSCVVTTNSANATNRFVSRKFCGRMLIAPHIAAAARLRRTKTLTKLVEEIANCKPVRSRFGNMLRTHTYRDAANSSGREPRKLRKASSAARRDHRMICSGYLRARVERCAKHRKMAEERCMRCCAECAASFARSRGGGDGRTASASWRHTVSLRVVGRRCGGFMAPERYRNVTRADRLANLRYVGVTRIVSRRPETAS